MDEKLENAFRQWIKNLEIFLDAFTFPPTSISQTFLERVDTTVCFHLLKMLN